ncbi:hypothetical protein [Pseudomonas sp.]|uniref:hypothetical protein n=1 Tax=Pseudomonas sp. TaxID=306 RepID=UPI0026176770|nr:hypothetical protein [Pseudomonas sp.]
MNEFINLTTNQHFISQAEQRLNSCSENLNPSTAKIHRFNIESLDPPSVSIEKPALIARNLAFQELFTLARIGNKERLNLETFFGRYEGPFPEKASNLLKWIDRVKSKSSTEQRKIDLSILDDCDFSLILDDVKFIFKFKFMAGLRNPHQIKRTLANFSYAVNHCPNEIKALELYSSLEKKNKSEEDYICKTYQVSPEEYREWIRLLIFFLYVNEEDKTTLDGFIEEFFTAKELFTSIQVHSFDSECALLTDTGIVIDHDLTYFMNVSKNCIIALRHVDIARDCDARDFSRERKMAFVESCGGKLQGSLFIDDRDILSGYNKICVKTSFKKVFSASDEIVGVSIINRTAKN